MNKSNIKSQIVSFCQNDESKITIAQLPNIPLTGWLLVELFSLFIKDIQLKNNIQDLATALLFTWAYLELTRGSSNFRKTLGGVAMILIVISFFR